MFFKLASKEKEIMRMKKMLDGGRPLNAVAKDCCCKKTEKSSSSTSLDSSDLKLLQFAKMDLEEQLKGQFCFEYILFLNSILTCF